MRCTSPSDCLYAWLLVLVIGLLGLVSDVFGSGLQAIAVSLAAILLFCCCCRSGVEPLLVVRQIWRDWKPSRFSANLVLLLAALLWGSGNVAQKTVLDHLGPFAVVGFRGLLATLVVLPLALREGRRTASLCAVDWRLLASMAGLFTLATALTQIGFGGTSVTNGGFLINTSAVMTPLLGWLIYHVRPRPMVWPAVASTLAGIWLLGGSAWMRLSSGDGLCVLAAAAYALWIVQIAVFVQRTGRPMLAAAAQFAVTAVIGLAIGIATEPVAYQGVLAALPELLVIGVVSTGIGFMLTAFAQQHTPAADAAILMSAESLFGALAAALLLGERLSPDRLFGAALLMLAIILVQLPEQRPQLRSKTVSPVPPARPAFVPDPA